MQALWVSTLILSSLAGQAPARPEAASLGTPIADFALRDYRGAGHNLSDWQGSKLVTVVFLGVDEQDLRSPALKFMQRFGITYPIVADNLSLTGHYGVTGYPETFFIDRRGRVVPPHIVGPASRKKLDEGIRKALGT